MKRTALALLLCLPCVAAAQQGQRLAVVELDTPPEMIGLGAQLAKSVIEAAEAQGYTVTPPDVVRTQLGEERLKQLQRCGGLPACVQGKLQGLDAQRAVVGSLRRDEKHYLVKLWLIDLATASLVADVDRAILIASRRLQQDVAAAVPGLLRGEKEARGQLRLDANTKGVSIEIDGAPAGKTPLQIELKPGRHQLKAEKKAFYPIERYVTVTANTTTEEQLRLVKIPGEVAEDEVIPELQKRDVPVATAKAGAPHEAVALGVGAGIIAAAGVGFVIQHNQAVAAQGEGYKNTRQAKEDQRHATLLFAAAGITALSAVILGLTLDGDDKLEAAPAAGPGGGGVVVNGRF